MEMENYDSRFFYDKLPETEMTRNCCITKCICSLSEVISPIIVCCYSTFSEPRQNGGEL